MANLQFIINQLIGHFRNQGSSSNLHLFVYFIQQFRFWVTINEQFAIVDSGSLSSTIVNQSYPCSAMKRLSRASLPANDLSIIPSTSVKCVNEDREPFTYCQQTLF
jgi:hypothetical protein